MRLANIATEGKKRTNPNVRIWEREVKSMSKNKDGTWKVHWSSHWRHPDADAHIGTPGD